MCAKLIIPIETTAPPRLPNLFRPLAAAMLFDIPFLPDEAGSSLEDGFRGAFVFPGAPP
jgi:hypothetical protein